jgi:signal transduction histidine kinase
VQDKGLDLPFILVSGAIGEEAAVTAMRAGAHDYVMKGNITRLAPAVERELREAAIRRERRRAEQERERLLAELEDRSKELSQLLFISSHDLQEPLVNIQGFAREMELSLKEAHSLLESRDIPHAVKERLSATIDKDITHSLNYILSSSSKIDTLLKGLLKVSRLGRVTLTIEKLNMNDLIAKVVESFEFQIRKEGAKLEVERLPPCRGDRAQINQVFSNLISNALKYLDPELPGIIRISGRKEDNKVVYIVEDNGIGIAPEHHEMVFQIFQRVHPKDSSGEGLGLTIVRHILERHGGNIWLESEPGKGSRFYVSLPTKD